MPVFSFRFLFVLLLFAALAFPAPSGAAELYAQAPFTKAELHKFIDDLPRFRAWVKANKEKVHPDLDPDGKPAFFYSPKAAAQVESLGWKAERFFCVMGRAAAAVALIERGPGIKSAPPADMPKVAAQEMDAVQENLSALLSATSRR